MIARRERRDDEAWARAIVVAAFDRRDDVEAPEARLLDELRECDEWIPALSLFGVIDDQIVAQRSGIGSALMRTMFGTAAGMGEPLVALLGSPEYYSRFGFRPSLESGIEPPDPDWKSQRHLCTACFRPTAWVDIPADHAHGPSVCTRMALLR